jgi:hypothetical protein
MAPEVRVRFDDLLRRLRGVLQACERGVVLQAAAAPGALVRAELEPRPAPAAGAPHARCGDEARGGAAFACRLPEAGSGVDAALTCGWMTD